MTTKTLTLSQELFRGDALREALADTPREQFDKELRQLRVAGRYGLSGAESRWGISQAEREAGIHEAGSLLMLVSRRT